MQQQQGTPTKEGEVGEGEQVEQQKPEEFACRSSTHLLTACKGGKQRMQSNKSLQVATQRKP